MSDTNYVYVKSERNLYTVGFYRPDGRWEAESDSKVEVIVRLEAIELKAHRERLCNQLMGLNVELGFGLQQEMGIERL